MTWLAALHFRRRSLWLFCLPLLTQAADLPPGPPPFPAELKKEIHSVIIIYPENRSFDSLYGSFPGASGLDQAGASAKIQLRPVKGIAGKWEEFDYLPIPTTGGIPGITRAEDSRFAHATLPNGPYDLTQYIPPDAREGDMVHRFYTEQYQINALSSRFAKDPKNAGGEAMSKFATWSDNGGMTMGHFDAQNLGEGRLAHEYVLCDNAFHSAFGGSFLNHQWLIAARTPVWPAKPAEGSGPPSLGISQLDANGFPKIVGKTLSDAMLTEDSNLPGFPRSNAAQTLQRGDYWCINTALPLRGPAGGFTFIRPNVPPPDPVEQPTPPTTNEVLEARLPLQEYDTIGDRLSSARITWAWFSEGWDAAKSGQADYLFQFHHQPFAYFKKYALAKSPIPATGLHCAVPGEDSEGSRDHLQDFDHDFLPALQQGDLPQVCFIKPIGEHNQHPGYATVQDGQTWVWQTVTAIQHSSIWAHCVIFVIYDEHGGQWDHVAPPAIDPWGPGTRVPLTVISPLAKHGFVDHTRYETVSILAFLEGLFDLPPLNERDRSALPILSSFLHQPDLVISGQSGQPFEYMLPAFNAPDHYTAEGDLDGLTLEETTGKLTGSFRQPGSFPIQVRAQGKGADASYLARLDIAAP